MSRVQLDLDWEGRLPAEAEDARRLSSFVSGLAAFDPTYSSWLRSPTAKSPVFRVPLSQEEAARALDARKRRYDDGRPWPELGMRERAGNAGPPPFDFRERHMAVTEFHIGACDWPEVDRPNNISMRLAEERNSTGRAWRASELRPLMKFARRTWEPRTMCAYFAFCRHDFPTIPDAARPDDARQLEPRIGWITYLPPDLAARATYPADVEVETLDDGAVLVTLCEEPFEKGDAEGLAKLHALEAALRPIQS